MAEVSLSQARARSPELLDRVAAGEEVHISRHGHALAVLINHDRWMKTRTNDVLIEARELRKRLEVARDHPIAPESLARDYDVDGHVAWLRDEDKRRPEADGGWATPSIPTSSSTPPPATLSESMPGG